MANKGAKLLPNKIAVLAGSYEQIEPIEPLADQANFYFKMLLLCRAPVDWIPTDILLLTKLAKLMHECDKLQETLDREGYTDLSPKGGQIVNPTFTVLNAIESRVIVMQTKLGAYVLSKGSQGGKQTTLIGTRAKDRLTHEKEKTTDIIG